MNSYYERMFIPSTIAAIIDHWLFAARNEKKEFSFAQTMHTAFQPEKRNE
jgi:hypothetical protein